MCSIIHLSPTLCSPMYCSVRQALMPMEFSRQEYWSGVALSTSGGLPEPVSLCILHWQADSLPPAPPGEAM